MSDTQWGKLNGIDLSTASRLLMASANSAPATLEKPPKLSISKFLS